MKPKRVLTLCIGISHYDKDALKGHEQPLNYLANSAEKLNELFRKQWPETTSHHLLFVDKQATYGALLQATAECSGRYDFLVMYMAGHGRIENDKYRFLFFGGTAEENAVGTEKIEILIENVGPSNCLLLLDSCHSGGFIQESGYFRSLGSKGNRFCLVSCLPNQLSWEDEELGFSIFAHVLIGALSSTFRDEFSVSDHLLEHVGKKVTSHAFGLKRSAAQEPVGGGVLHTPMVLPASGQKSNSYNSFSTHQLLIRRVRQMGAITVLMALLTVMIVSMVSWRPALNNSGMVELRAGPKWLAFLNVGPWKTRVETGIVIDQLRSDNDLLEVQQEIIDEEGAYLWPGLTSFGVRRWSETVFRQFLNESRAALWRVDLGDMTILEHLTETHSRYGIQNKVLKPFGTAVLSRASVLNSTVLQNESWKLDWENRVVKVQNSCVSENTNQNHEAKLGLYLHLSDPDDFESWLDGLSLIALGEPELGLEYVAQLLEMFSSANDYWARWFEEQKEPEEPISPAWVAARYSERPKDFEVESVGRLAEAIIARRLHSGETPVTDEERSRLLSLVPRCRTNLVQVLARMGTYGSPSTVIEWARKRASFDQGRIPLLRLANRGSLSTTEIEWVLRAAGVGLFDADGKWSFDNVSDWLFHVTAEGNVSSEMIDYLLDFSEVYISTANWQVAHDALAISAQAYELFTDAQRMKFRRVFSTATHKIGEGIYTEGAIEILGILAKSGYPLSKEQTNLFTSIIEPSNSSDIPPVLYTSDDTYLGGGMIELGAGIQSAHLVALARYAQKPVVDLEFVRSTNTINFFVEALSAGLELGVKTEILQEVSKAAAIAWGNQHEGTGRTNVRAVVKELARNSRDYWNRKAIEAVAIHLYGRSPNVIDELRSAWKVETEPEVKRSLASIIVGIAYISSSLSAEEGFERILKKFRSDF